MGNPVDDKLILELEALGKLSLSEEERVSAKKDFAQIIDYMNILDNFKEDSGEEFTTFTLAENLRDDIPSDSKKTEEYVSDFLGKEISVPEVIK